MQLSSLCLYSCSVIITFILLRWQFIHTHLDIKRVLHISTVNVMQVNTCSLWMQWHSILQCFILYMYTFIFGAVCDITFMKLWLLRIIQMFLVGCTFFTFVETVKCTIMVHYQAAFTFIILCIYIFIPGFYNL